MSKAGHAAAKGGFGGHPRGRGEDRRAEKVVAAPMALATATAGGVRK